MASERRPARTPTGAAEAVAHRFYEAFNAGDWVAYAALLDEAVEVRVDAALLPGQDAVCTNAAVPERRARSSMCATGASPPCTAITSLIRTTRPSSRR